MPPGLTTVSCEFTVAGGRFAPGHLGELTQVLLFDLLDAVLEETLTVQRRLRDLPSCVGVYFVLAMCLFPEVGYRLVWQKLTTALAGAGLEIAWPTAKALRDLRRRVGAVPMRRLFDILAGPLARPTTHAPHQHAATARTTRPCPTGSATSLERTPKSTEFGSNHR